MIPFSPDEPASWKNGKLSSKRKHSNQIGVAVSLDQQYLVQYPTQTMNASFQVSSFQQISLMAMSWWVFCAFWNDSKREEEKNLRKVRTNSSQHFQCACSHLTSLFVIIVVLKERSNKREHKKYAMNCYCVWKLRRRFGIIKIYSLCFDTRVTSIN